MAAADNPRMENPNQNAPATGVPPLINPGVSVTAALRGGAHQLGAAVRAGAAGGTMGNQQQGAQPPNNNNAGEMPQQTQNIFYMRDRLFLALFFRVTLIYARAFPKTLRRILEFFLLMQSIVLLFLLCYIHIVYTRTPITCLNKYKDSWPRDGILRVEITSDGGDDYDISKSYEKEEKLRQRVAASQMNHYSEDLLSMMFTADQILLDRVVSTAGGFISSVTSSSKNEDRSSDDDQSVNPTASVADGDSSMPSTTTSTAEVELPPTEDVENPLPEVVSSEGAEIIAEVDSSKVASGRKELLESSLQNKSAELEEDTLAAAEGEDKGTDGGDASSSGSSFSHSASGEGSDVDSNNPHSPYFNKTLEEIEIMKMEAKQREDEKVLKTTVSDLEMFANAVFMPDQAYIVEYALEYGFLRLSPETRQRLNIPVKIVTLDPTKESCFGDSFSVFLLENFLGYDDILMSSIKNLAEAEENKGYLRNVVTGEQFRFVPMWMARTSYIPAMLIMLVFYLPVYVLQTVSISMLLRYSHHQIFIFIVDLLNNIEGAGSIHIPAAPLFTVILALVGMEAIMSEFFNDTSTAFYVILIVWIADQYDSVCSHTSITKTFWVRFFYLYHFAFYAYHYRFNGQYSGLALLVSWSFIQHSMVYFYHHYELPAILRQAQQPGIPTQFFTEERNSGASPPSATPSSSGSNSTASSPTTESASAAAPTADPAAGAASTASAHGTGAGQTGGEGGSSREQTLQPAPPLSIAGQSSSAGGSQVPIGNITVTLSSPVSAPVSVEISTLAGQAPASGHLRRRVTSTTSTLHSTSSGSPNPASSAESPPAFPQEVRSFFDAFRSNRGSNANERGSSSGSDATPTPSVDVADFSTHVSVSFSEQGSSTVSSSPRRVGSGVSVTSILGSGITTAAGTAGSTAAGTALNHLTGIQ